MRRIGIALLACAALFGTAATAHAATVVNGDFETGDLSGWTVDLAGAGGNWFNYSASNLVPPLSGAGLSTTVAAPPQGTHAALTDMTSPGRRTLYQDVALEPLVAPGTTLTLSLYVYYKAQQGNVFFTPSPDQLTASGANQQVRVEVVKPSAPIASVDPADILATAFRTNTGDPLTLVPQKVTADLTPFAGQTVRIRVSEVDTAGVVNASVDDVKVTTTTPDPTIQFSPPTRDRSNGTATLPAAVSGPGSVVISGDGIETQTVQSTGAGTVQLPVTPVDPLKSKVQKKRSGQANIVATFTDSRTGKTVSDKRRVHLRHKRN